MKAPAKTVAVSRKEAVIVKTPFAFFSNPTIRARVIYNAGVVPIGKYRCLSVAKRAGQQISPANRATSWRKMPCRSA
jgi:hypothetical protein